MINHATIQALIHYLESNPRDAQQFTACLERITKKSGESRGGFDRQNYSHNTNITTYKSQPSAEGGQACGWLSLREAGREVGMSASWVRAQLPALRGMRYQQITGRRSWFIHEDALPLLTDIKLKRKINR